MKRINLNKSATKGDLLEFKQTIKKDLLELEQKLTTTTKKDLLDLKQEFKQELSKFATKEEMDYWIGRLHEEILITKNEVAELKEIMLIGFDRLSKNIEDIRADMASFNFGHNRHEEKLGNHEIRITVLENH